LRAQGQVVGIAGRRSAHATGRPLAAQQLSSACPDGSGTDVATPTSDGGCRLQAKFSGCQRDGQTVDVSSGVTWNAAYTSATGVQIVTLEGVCTGTYAVTIAQP
jgi:hypothetical protein